MNKNVVVEVPRSGKRIQFTNQLTSQVGTITPIFVEECLPSQKTRLEMAIKCSLPPLASDAFMNVKLKCEAFFVPMRILCGSFESFFSNFAERVQGDSQIEDLEGFLPYMSFDYSIPSVANAFDRFVGTSSLADYLGWKSFIQQPSPVSIDVPLLPFLAYHKIWNDCYRNSRITQSCFARPNFVMYQQNRDYVLASAPYIFFDSTLDNAYNADLLVYDNSLPTSVDFLADDISVFSLRQRNYGYDYFTMAMPTPQLGAARQVAVSHPSGNEGHFTIAALRAENALQQFADRNGLGGLRIQDVVRQRYGADLSGLVAQQAICIGACDYDVYTDGVTNNQQSTPTASNPLSGYGGSRSGVAYAQGHDLIIDDFVSNEPGYLFVMATLVPKAQYRSGIRRYLQHFIDVGSISDLADPILQSVGPQPIFGYELQSHLIGTNSIFGYTDRYAEYFTHENEIHGLFNVNGSLKNFVSARDFGSSAETIDSGFLEIKTTDLNNVTAVSAQLSNYGYQLQVAFDLSKILPLEDYSLPTLQDPAYEHGKKVSIVRGGFKL